MSEVGDNSGAVNAGHLRSLIERIENREQEKALVADDIKEIYAEAKGMGFDAPTIRKIVAIRKKDRDKQREEIELLRLYADAIQLELGL